MSWPLVAMVGLALILAGCTGGDDEVPLVGSSLPPTTVLADCPVVVAEPPSEWPLALPPSLVVTEYTVNENSFLVRGVSNDAETLLVQSTEETLAEFTVAEPEGGANDVVVVFESAVSTGSLFMTDEDGDDCWDVDLEVEFFGDPEPAGFIPTTEEDEIEEEEAAAGTPSEGSGLVPASGAGSVTSARGSFPIFIADCQVEPLLITGSSNEGELSIVESPSGDVALTWTYTDGVVIEDLSARAVMSSANAALVIGDGQNAEGPETVIADVNCDAS